MGKKVYNSSQSAGANPTFLIKKHNHQRRNAKSNLYTFTKALQPPSMAHHLVMGDRSELLVSPTGGDECLVRAHFLTPTGGAAPSPYSSSSATAPDFEAQYKDLPLKVDFFRGWKNPQKNWREWVNQMKPLHASTWKKAGIFEAIMCSTYKIHRNSDLIYAFAEKWCPETSSFVFPWGEATITLEDVMILGEYSVLGEFVLSSEEDGEMTETLTRLQSARLDMQHTSTRNADQDKWLSKFMGSQSEVEHEAFLAFWLSRFVFPVTQHTIARDILPIAVRMARGIRVALAPPVLASIYRHLTSLRTAIVDARKCGTSEGHDSVHKVTMAAPLALLQVWIWERFPALSPKPNSINEGEPRLARWQGIKKHEFGEILDKLNSAAENFRWRPYVMCRSSTVFHGKIYKENGYWELVGSNLDEDLEALVRCMRRSDLVGLEANCIERYLPHRVAMQFGFDQDIPGHVERVRSSSEVAWSHYCRPIRDAELYVPPLVTLPRVTTRYLDRWLGINVKVEKDLDGAEVVTSKKGSSKRLKRKSISPNTRSVSPPPGFARKHKGLSGRPFSSTVNDCAEVVLSQRGSSKCPKGNGSDSPPPPGFARKHNSGKEHIPGSGINEKEAEASTGSRCSRCNQLQETGPNIEVNPTLTLEERISNIEKLLHWIAGKLDKPTS